MHFVCLASPRKQQSGTLVRERKASKRNILIRIIWIRNALAVIATHVSKLYGLRF